MAEAMKSVDSAQITAEFGGVNLNQGTADGEWLTLEPQADLTTVKVGADGSIVRGKTKNRLWTMTVRLLETSAVNSALSAIAALDAIQEGGAGVVPLMVRDRGGTTLLAAERAWISKMPAVGFSTEPMVREWQIQAEIPLPVVGSHL